MTGFFAWPIEIRLTCLATLGACAASLVFALADRLGFEASGSSPWTSASGPWWRRVPIFGRVGQAGHLPALGRGSWLGPMLVELAVAVGFAWLYWWEVERQGVMFGKRDVANLDLVWVTRIHLQCAAHLVLGCFMLLATMVDIREKLIPDAITVPGTLLGLLAAAVAPHSLLPIFEVHGETARLTYLQATSPFLWPAELNAVAGLAIGLACWFGWCFALLPRVWYPNHGQRRAWAIFWTHLIRRAAWGRLIVMAGLGTATITAVWRWVPSNWPGLLSALLGMAFGASLVWSIRLLGGRILGREAMGFGDVTLLGMIGAFLGWQGALFAFFLAPLAALVVGLAILLLRRETEIAFGPFLCMGAIVTIVRWHGLWTWGAPLFSLGRFLLLVFLGCMLLMAVLLMATRAVRSFLANTTH